MSRSQRTLDRDEVRLATGTIARIVADDIWVEFESPINTDDLALDQPGNTITGRYQINDLVTDAVNVTVLDSDPIDGDLPRADYAWDEFRANAEDGYLIPKSLLTEDTDKEHHAPDEADLMEVMATAVNASNVDAGELMNLVDSEHNHLQNEVFMSIVKPVVLAVATTPQYDTRNETARNQAREIISALNWEIPDSRQRY